jgi:hypothetical protein
MPGGPPQPSWAGFGSLPTVPVPASVALAQAALNIGESGVYIEISTNNERR